MSYDCLLLASIMFNFTLVLIVLRGGAAITPASWRFDAGLLMVALLFYCWFWTHGGQTLGMRAWKIRLERFDGRAPEWSDALRRYVAAWILLLPPGLGFLWGALDRDRLCWHDRPSKTRIVKL